MEEILSQNSSILLFAMVGFLAQVIDGGLGMAYGVSSNAVLLALGIPPKLASASVHAAEVVTTAISGLSHFRVGNVDKKLALRLILPGMVGAVAGAYILTRVDGDTIKPWIAVYLLIMGVVILIRAFARFVPAEIKKRFLPPLGIAGGFFDAIGGGGWGPIVTTTLVATGKEPRFAVGSVNLSEFFVTVSSSVTFILTIGSLADYWRIILGLLIGGALAAPLAAFACKWIPKKAMMLMVGALIVFLQVRTLLGVWFEVKIL